MKKILIIGGCGFIGCNATLYFSQKKYKVTVIDNLKGNSSKRNLKLLKKLNRKINFFHFDIKNLIY